MRRVRIDKGDFALFHSDINPVDFEFFRTHTGAFKRMWKEQTRQFWALFVDMFDHFIWKYGVMKDFPLKIDDVRKYVDEVISLVQMNFVEGNASSARTFVTDCAIVAQNRHYIGALDKAPYSQNPFYIKDTRETFRKLFGPPKSKTTFMKVLCGLPIYVKFAGTAVTFLRRWLVSDELDDDDSYLLELSILRADDKAALDAIERTIISEKTREKLDKPTVRVSKKHFANEETKLKALEWSSSNSTDVGMDLEELDPTPAGKLSYKSAYKQTIQSVTQDVRDSLVESIAEVKIKEIERVRERGEDVEPIIEEFKASLDKRKRKRKKKGKGENEISALIALHKEVSSSEKHLEIMDRSSMSFNDTEVHNSSVTEDCTSANVVADDMNHVNDVSVNRVNCYNTTTEDGYHPSAVIDRLSTDISNTPLILPLSNDHPALILLSSNNHLLDLPSSIDHLPLTIPSSIDHLPLTVPSSIDHLPLTVPSSIDHLPLTVPSSIDHLPLTVPSSIDHLPLTVPSSIDHLPLTVPSSIDHLPLTVPSSIDHLPLTVPSSIDHLPLTVPSSIDHLPLTVPSSIDHLPLTVPSSIDHLPLTVPSSIDHLPLTIPSSIDHLPLTVPSSIDHLPLTVPSSNDHPQLILLSSNGITPSDLPSSNDITPSDLPSSNGITPSDLPSSNGITPSDLPSSNDITPSDLPSSNDITPSDLPSSNDITPSDLPSSNDITPSDLPSSNGITPSDLPSSNGITPSDLPSSNNHPLSSSTILPSTNINPPAVDDKDKEQTNRPSTVGPSTVGPSTVGLSTVGPSTVGPSTVGLSTVGPYTVGPSTVGPSTVGPSTVGPSTVGPSTVGPSTVGPSTVGPSTVGPSTVCNDVKKKLHQCSCCLIQETIPKTFKRCVKCRGKPNPRYYCSKECQVSDWKSGHRCDHENS